jgi:peptidoglycan/xylan/chitin deacetylase (PgdA/CDA1 family)
MRPTLGQSLKHALEFLWVSACRAVTFRAARGPRRIVLYYHGVSGAEAAGFRRQMEYLAGHCLLVEATKILTTPAEDNQLVLAVTFDDALVSVARHAAPVMREHGVPGTVFVPVADMGKTPAWAGAQAPGEVGELVMDERQIVELERWGFEIQSHTLTHPDLTRLDEARLGDELAESKRRLEDILGHAVTALSYPHGRCNASVAERAVQAGYQMGFSIEPTAADFSPDPLRIGRFSVSPQESLATFRLKVSGAYTSVRHLRKWKRLALGK